jgi:YD repeat-containing protein
LALLATSPDSHADDLTITNHFLPGDGKTPTFMQYLDTQKITAKEAIHLANASPKGPVVYRYEIPLPPALFKPDLSLNYSSDAGPNAETPGLGWSLAGIPEISRPLTRAFTLKSKDEWCDAEWIASGSRFSGTLSPSSAAGDCHFYLKTSGPVFVVADYDASANAWTFVADGVTTTLTAADDGADTEAGTARWRATEAEDASGNSLTYCYDDDGRVTDIGYGGNEDTGEDHLMTVAFAYGDNTVERASYRTGFKVEYEKHIEKITIQSGWNDPCGDGKSASKHGLPFVRNAVAAKAQTTMGATVKAATGQTIQTMSSGAALGSGSKSSVGSSTVVKETGPVKTTSGAASKVGACKADDDDAEDEDNRLYAIDLVTTSSDYVDLLTKLEREGLTSCDAEVIAEFDYTDFKEESSGSTGTAPASLGYATFEDKNSNSTAWSKTNKALMDANRDGLPDVIDATDADSTEKWKITSQGVDHEDRTFSWNSEKEVDTLAQSLDYTETQKDTSSGAPAYNVACTTVQTTDFDGDGYLDVVVAGDPDKWTVHYGTGNADGTVSQNVAAGYLIAAITGGSSAIGKAQTIPTDTVKSLDKAGTIGSSSGSVKVDPDTVETADMISFARGYFYAVTEEPPQDADWTCIRENWRLKAEHDDADEITTDQLYGALDLDGDGFLDLLRPAEGKLWKHTGKRGGGWEEATTLSTEFSAMRKVNYTIDVEPFDIGCEDLCSSLATMTAPAIYQDPEGDADCANSISGCSDGYDETTYNSCMAACGGHQTFSIVHTDETGGFYDLNGDGLADYVSSASTPWRVYFGTGYDVGGSAIDGESVSWQSPVAYTQRVDEGSAYKDWEDQRYSYRDFSNGTPTRLYQTLLDVNGDGLLDLVLGNKVDIDGDGRTDSNENSESRVWYLNTGAGFDLAARDLPDWWPGEFTSSYSTSEVKSDDASGVGATTTATQMTDLNHDGSLDYVSVAWHYDSDDGDVDAGSNEVKYGPYPRPFLLEQIETGQSGTTGMSYRSLSTVAPAGDWDEKQKTPNVLHLADVITSTDPLTGQKAETSFDYADGEYDDGVWEGFGERSVTREINGGWTSRTEYEYELSPHYDPIPATTRLYTDFNLSFGQTIKKGDAKEGLRYALEDEHDNFGAQNQLRLVSTRKITEYGEGGASKFSAITGNSGKTSTITFGWDDKGNMTSFAHDGGGSADDAITVTMDYVSDAEGTLSRISQKTVAGYDPLAGSSRDISTESYYYDDHADIATPLSRGWLTRTVMQAGWTAGGEAIDAATYAISYERGERGEMTKATDEASGIWVEQSFGFGGAVLENQTNALGHTIAHGVDAQGRVTKTVDANGLSLNNTYDAFDRVTKTTATGKNGTTQTLKTTAYARSDAPYYDKVQFYDEAGVEETFYTLMDGFGHEAQVWTQNAGGDYLATTKIIDLRGLTVKTSHPENKGSAFTQPSTLGVTATLMQQYHDALGMARETVRDAAKGLDAQTVSFDSPRQEVRQDEEGYQSRQTYDAHGRVIRVEQGKSDSYATTAEYDYDPAGKLVAFRDGAGVCYAYSYDAAGRLRQVLHGTAEASTAAARMAEDNGLVTTIFDFIASPLEAAGISSAATNAAMTKTSVITTGTAVKTSSTASSAVGSVASLIQSLAAGFSTSSASKALADCSATTPWVTYEYKGMLKTKMTDATGLYVSWEYDAAGRPVQISASDGLPAAATDLAYAFDYDDAWTGAVYKTTDTAGTITLAYDEFGRPSAATRVFAATAANPSGKIAGFSYENDIRGRVKTRTLPSGRALSTDYDHGRLTTLTAKTAETTDYSLAVTYNDYHQWSSVTSSLGHAYTRTFTTPLWPDEIAVAAGGKNYKRAYEWLDNGLLSRRTNSDSSTKTSSSKISSSKFGSSLTKSSATSPSTGTRYDYAYDSLKQIASLTSTKIGSTAGPTAVEAYAFDAAGNPTAMTDANGAAWTYGGANTLNQIENRTSSSGATEKFTYDAMGRLTERQSTSGTYAYYYDGFQRLRGVSLNGVWQEVLDYDADGNLARRADSNPHEASPYYLFEFREWRLNEKTGAVTEEDHPLVVTDNGARKWLLREHDGHAALSFDDAGSKTSSRVLGAFGATLSSSGTSWDKASFHGAEEKNALLHMGQRHLMKGDGTWLVAEPLLYLGIPDTSLVTPLALATRRYAMNAPTTYLDTNGFDPYPTSQQEVEPPTSDASTGIDSVTGVDNSEAPREMSGEELMKAVNPQGTKDICGLEASAVAESLKRGEVITVDNPILSDVQAHSGGGIDVPSVENHFGTRSAPVAENSYNSQAQATAARTEISQAPAGSIAIVTVVDLAPGQGVGVDIGGQNFVPANSHTFTAVSTPSGIVTYGAGGGSGSSVIGVMFVGSVK